MIEEVKLFRYHQSIAGYVICPCPLAIYMYKIVISLKHLLLLNLLNIFFIRFHMGASVKRMLTIWSNDSAPLKKMAAMPS